MWIGVDDVGRFGLLVCVGVEGPVYWRATLAPVKQIGEAKW